MPYFLVVATYGTGLVVLAFSLATVVAQDVVPVLRSCHELKLAGYVNDNEYRIDPDGPGRGVSPFVVYCDMFNEHGPTSIVEHDQMFHGIVPNGFEDAGEFRIPVSYEYGSTIEQVSKMADISADCSQYLRIDCYHITMWWKGDIWGFWVSRNGSLMTNWGTPTGTRGCKCSLTRSCVNEERQTCNCDANDDAWRMDDGDITDKGTLPVTELRFGDTGGLNEKVVYRVGPLKCWGMEQQGFPSCDAWAAAGFYGEGDYLIQPSGGGAEVQRCNERYLMDPPPILRSCEELRLAGYTDHGEYMIDPDFPSSGLPPFLVYCDMTSGTTIVKHDRQGIQLSNGLEAPGEHAIVVHYNGASIQQVAGLADVSGNCQQYISKQCHGSGMWSQPDDNYMYTWWVSRNGLKMANWATPTGTEGCPCSLTRSCQIFPNKHCNCDSNDAVWREDNGNLTDKSTLPVSQIRIGDTGSSSEVALYTLGEFTCTGIGSRVYTSCASLQEDGISGGGHYLIDSDGSEGSNEPSIVRCNETTDIVVPIVACPTQQQMQTTVSSGNKLMSTQLPQVSQQNNKDVGVSPDGSPGPISTNIAGPVAHSQDLLVNRSVSVQAVNFFVVGLILVLLIVIAVLIIVTLQWKKVQLALKTANTNCAVTAKGPQTTQQDPPESPNTLSHVRFFNPKSELQTGNDEAALI